MTIQEMSTEFDVLYNNVTSNQAPGLNEYEKSVFLTKAQSQLVNEYFNTRTDGFGGGYDGSQKRQYDFSSLVRTEKLYNVNTFKERISDDEKLDKRSLVYLFPTNYYLAVNEILSDSKWQYSVIPIDYSEYGRLMMKPYSFPVKRSAWRLLTDKKNCNYVHEDAEGNDLKNTPSVADYSILSAWADQRRNLEVTFKVGNYNSDPVASVISAASSNTVSYNWTDSDNVSYTLDLWAATKWSDDHLTYRICLAISDSDFEDIDDEMAIQIWQSFFTDLNNGEITGVSIDSDNKLAKAATHLDGLLQAEAPSKFVTFQESAGRKFTTSVVAVPFAEIIGKFTGDVDYHLRYVRTLSPIILDDLSIYDSDLTISGLSDVSETTLPAEAHHEIVERAVTLAKIAWQGGTATQAQAQRDN